MLKIYVLRGLHFRNFKLKIRNFRINSAGIPSKLRVLHWFAIIDIRIMRNIK